ncbi:lysophospholipid acyltransferase family protein [Pseudonocardia sp. WMMC193]|uniref:lysophospholipid acyltransferase family protein n=1 Tax=Pseudonocardia sp. WMMC193 TaxID=2911965 RepID=UPI001F459419|nr:lysophospholipid acyltransferase family protein [Pseudonocardia sp. WMMC193]MCF7552927.1 acyltransferase family protein [Pseudonocardia sp. WMMC193]
MVEKNGKGARVPEARVIPLHADDTGGRTRWRLGAGETRPRGRSDREPSGRARRSDAGTSGPSSTSRASTTPRPRPPADDAPPQTPPIAVVPDPEPPAWESALESALRFVRRRLAGDYPVDEFGYDPELAESVIAPVLQPLYQHWFRVETIGMQHVPDSGGALIVANHSGTLPLDALMTIQALHSEHPTRRRLRLLGADLMFRLPIVGELARKNGATLACNPDAERLMGSGELVGVFPEGFKGIGKPFADRYKLQRFGRGGFVSAALRTGVPIIPCSIVGAEETYPKIGDVAPLARLLGAPYFPITPTFPLLGPLGLVPLPSKWYIEFGEPIMLDRYTPADAEDPMLVFNLTDQVRETIQHTLYRLLSQRRNVFLG